MADKDDLEYCVYVFPSGQRCGNNVSDKERKLCSGHVLATTGEYKHINHIDKILFGKAGSNGVENIYARGMSLKFKDLLTNVSSKEHNGHLELKNEVEIARVIAQQAAEVYDRASISPEELREKFIKAGMTQDEADKKVLDFKIKSGKLISQALKQVADITEKCARVSVLKEALPKTNITTLVLQLQMLMEKHIRERINKVESGLGDKIMKELSEAYDKISLFDMNDKASININI